MIHKDRERLAVHLKTLLGYNKVPEQKTPLIVGFDGVRLDTRISERLKKINPIGIILFKRNIISFEQTRDLIISLRALLGELIVTIDHEGGLVNRLPPAIMSAPSAFALGQLSDEDCVRDALWWHAKPLSEMGFDLNLAPVLDLFIKEGSPAIGMRAFSGDPGLTGRYGEIFLETHRSWGLGCCVKHFPGHGRSRSDTHFEEGQVEVGLDLLEGSDLEPFARTIKDAAAVMPAHLVYPALDPENMATFSSGILSGLLRGKMGFEGLLISDCVEMKAISGKNDPRQIVQRGLKAGLDLFISSYSLIKNPGFQLEMADALMNALKSEGGKERQAEIQQRLDGFRADFKRRDGLAPSPHPQRDLIGIHQKSIRVTRRRLASPENGIFLIELAREIKSGVAPEMARDSISGFLRGRLGNIKKSLVIDSKDNRSLEAAVKEANRLKLTAVFLSRDLFSEASFEAVTIQIKRAVSSLHIALLDYRDLQGAACEEWAVFGANSGSLEALIKMLNEFLDG